MQWMKQMQWMKYMQQLKYFQPMNQMQRKKFDLKNLDEKNLNEKNTMKYEFFFDEITALDEIDAKNWMRKIF